MISQSLVILFASLMAASVFCALTADVKSEPLPCKALPKCTCGPMTGYFCGSRVNEAIIGLPGYVYLSGDGCNQNVQYGCEQYLQEAKLIRLCPGAEGTHRCIQGEPGNDRCAGRQWMIPKPK